jgi:predicted alpha/beta hydrolase
MEPASTNLLARDGYRLAGSLYEPEDGCAPTVVIACATAVKRRFYDRFARFLCTRGLRVVTFDYRGIGDSLYGDIRAMPGTMRDWGRHDLAGVLDEVSTRYPRSRLLLVGHSAGGQLLGLADNNRLVKAMLAIGAQSGYWRHWPQPQRYALATLWYALMPGTTRLISYFPAKRMGLGEDLPSGVALEWSEWCRRPGYISDPRVQPSLPLHFAEFEGRILAYSFDDDGMAPRPAVDALMGLYSRAQIEMRHLRASDVGARKIGHFGFFNEAFAGSLWIETSRWLSDAGHTAIRQ